MLGRPGLAAMLPKDAREFSGLLAGKGPPVPSLVTWGVLINGFFLCFPLSLSLFELCFFAFFPLAVLPAVFWFC